MKSKEEIESELVDLYYKLEELKQDETHGWANHTPEKEKIQSKIDTLEWVLKPKD